MKIRFLGTSHGVPMPGRHYQSILFEVNENLYLVDAGAPVMDILINAGYDLAKLKAVFVTHMHTDHMMGLVDMTVLSTWYYKNMSYQVYFPEQRGIDALKNFGAELLQTPLTDRVTFDLVKEGTFYEDENLKVTAVHTDHMDATTDIAYGFMIEADGKRVYVTGDMHGSLKDFAVDTVKGNADVVISECAHCSAEKLVEKLKEAQVPRAMVVHVFPLHKYDYMKAVRRELPFEMIFPNDGDLHEV